MAANLVLHNLMCARIPCFTSGGTINTLANSTSVFLRCGFPGYQVISVPRSTYARMLKKVIRTIVQQNL